MIGESPWKTFSLYSRCASLLQVSQCLTCSMSLFPNNNIRGSFFNIRIRNLPQKFMFGNSGSQYILLLLFTSPQITCITTFSIFLNGCVLLGIRAVNTALGKTYTTVGSEVFIQQYINSTEIFTEILQHFTQIPISFFQFLGSKQLRKCIVYVLKYS